MGRSAGLSTTAWKPAKQAVCGQCLEAGRRWLNAGGLEQEEEENKDSHLLQSESPAGTLAWMCAASALHFDLCKRYWSFLLKGLLASSLYLSPPTAQSSQSHSVFCIPTLPLCRLCLACIDLSRRAGAVCCSVCTALALLRPSGTAEVRVIMESSWEREFWLTLPESQQLPALVRARELQSSSLPSHESDH